MPAVQTTYGATHAAALAGMVANSEPSTVITRIVETAAGIAFGVPVFQGTADEQVIVAAADKKFLGIAVLDPTKDGDKHNQYENIPVMTKGVIWVTAGATVEAGQPVYYVPATGVWTDVATDNILVPEARWDSSAASALAKIRLG